MGCSTAPCNLCAMGEQVKPATSTASPEDAGGGVKRPQAVSPRAVLGGSSAQIFCLSPKCHGPHWGLLQLGSPRAGSWGQQCSQTGALGSSIPLHPSTAAAPSRFLALLLMQTSTLLLLPQQRRRRSSLGVPEGTGMAAATR